MGKVLILANSSAGLFDFRNELLLRLIAQGNEIVISLPDDVHNDEFEKEGCRVVHTDINRRGVNLLQDISLYREYKRLIKKENPQVVLSYTIKPNIYGGYACRKLGVPYLATITGLGSTFEKGGLFLKLIVVMYRVALKGCSCLVFQNEANRKIFEKYGIKAKKHITVSGSGVNLDKHFYEEYPGHMDDITRFLYVGRVMKEKGMDEYLYAAGKMKERYGAKVTFSVIGYYDGDYEEIMKAAEEKGYMKRIPFQKDIHPYMREADAIVHPSYHEGMSNVLMEAAATGRPVIATDISGCREIVDRDKSGLLFEAKNAEALVDVLDQFMNMSTDQRRAMGKAGRKWVEDNFDRNKVVDLYIEEINRIASEQ